MAFLVDFLPLLAAGEAALVLGGVFALVVLAGEALGFGVAALVTLVALAALAEAGEAAFVFGGVCAFAFAGEAFAFSGDAFAFTGEVFFVTLPACTFSAAAAAASFFGELLVTLRSGLSGLALAFSAGVVAFFLPLALAGVPSARAFAMACDAMRCDAMVWVVDQTSVLCLQ